MRVRVESPLGHAESSSSLPDTASGPRSQGREEGRACERRAVGAEMAPHCPHPAVPEQRPCVYGSSSRVSRKIAAGLGSSVGAGSACCRSLESRGDGLELYQGRSQVFDDLARDDLRRRQVVEIL